MDSDLFVIFSYSKHPKFTLIIFLVIREKNEILLLHTKDAYSKI